LVVVGPTDPFLIADSDSFTAADFRQLQLSAPKHGRLFYIGLARPYAYAEGRVVAPAGAWARRGTRGSALCGIIDPHGRTRITARRNRGNGCEPLRHGPNPATTSRACRRLRPLRFDLWDATDEHFII
jgi:hypothetical protein